MRYLFALAALVLASPAPQDSRPTTDDAAKLVEKAAHNYLDAFYEVEPDLLDDSVHPELAKVGFWRPNPDDEYRVLPMSFAQLKGLAGRWNRNGDHVRDDTPRDVEILDMLDATAAVKVTAAWGIDYMQIGKFDGKWQIRHILWQSHPPQK